jgi:hypothetical protein
MRPRQFVTSVALCGTVVLAAWGTTRSGLGSFAVDNTATAIQNGDATSGAISLSPEADALDAPLAAATASLSEAATSDPDPTEPVFEGLSAADNTATAIKNGDAASGTISLSPEADALDATPATAMASLSEVAASDPDPSRGPSTTSGASSLSPEAADAPPITATASLGDSAMSVPDSTEPKVAEVPAAGEPSIETPLPDSRQATTPAPPVHLTSLFPSKAAIDEPLPPVAPLETSKECLEDESCINEYLWSLYERTPKVDTNKVTEQIKTKVKKKGKMRTVVTTITKYIVGDFTWKDPFAAQRAGMAIKDYVIGGMDRAFRLKLYRALRAMDEAGFMPGITSAFRDDYRQAITAGNKAASDSSYHGGSRRGGYGHGLAADLVSVKGETRMERYASSEELWKWIDAHEKELAIGRPYQDRDPPHVGPLDGKEYADKRGRANVQKAGSQTKKAQTARLETKKHGPINRDDPDTTKRARPEKSSSSVSSLQSRETVQP